MKNYICIKCGQEIENGAALYYRNSGDWLVKSPGEKLDSLPVVDRVHEVCYRIDDKIKRLPGWHYKKAGWKRAGLIMLPKGTR